MAQKSFDMGFAHLRGMSFSAVTLDEPDDTVAIGLLGSIDVMMIAQHLTNLIHQF